MVIIFLILSTIVFMILVLFLITSLMLRMKLLAVFLSVLLVIIMIYIFWRINLVLGIYTVFSRVDGCADGLMLERSDARFVRNFVSNIESRNASLKQKNYPLIDLSEYEIRKIGDFEDTTCVVTPLPVPVIIPLSKQSDDVD